MYIAQGSGEEEAGVSPQHEALGRPNKNRSGSEVEVKPAKKQLRNGGHRAGRDKGGECLPGWLLW